MYLKEIVANGFKSFADRTRIDMRPGVTAVVGPNGCGKSNIVDAIRWVLGEQSAKSLRAGAMQAEGDVLNLRDLSVFKMNGEAIESRYEAAAGRLFAATLIPAPL